MSTVVFFSLLYKLCQSHHWGKYILCHQGTSDLVIILINLTSCWMVVSVACGKMNLSLICWSVLFLLLRAYCPKIFLTKKYVLLVSHKWAVKFRWLIVSMTNSISNFNFTVMLLSWLIISFSIKPCK